MWGLLEFVRWKADDAAINDHLHMREPNITYPNITQINQSSKKPRPFVYV
jgi:hypothetical protein